MVQINPSESTNTVQAYTVNGGNTVQTALPPMHYAELSRAWAISEDVVQEEDYSSKHYSQESKDAANEALKYATGEPEEPENGSAKYWALRAQNSYKIGQVIVSLVPITDAALHKIDGSLIAGAGIYSDFVDYIAAKYEASNKYLNVKFIGSPIVDDFTVSGFSSGNYAYLETGRIPTNWEYNFTYIQKITTGDLSTLETIFAWGSADNNGIAANITTSGTIVFAVSSNGSTYDLINEESTEVLLPNTTYWIRYRFDDDTYIVDVSEDGETYVQYIAVESNVFPNKVSFMHFGGYYSSGLIQVFSGSIDFSECKLILDNKTVWSGTRAFWSTDETLWQNAVLDHHTCGKFVYDDTARTVRLPRVSGYIKGVLDDTLVGDFTPSALPNIEGCLGAARIGDTAGNGAVGDQYNEGGNTGALKASVVLEPANQNLATTTRTNGKLLSGINLDASQSNEIYGASDTVQTDSTSVIYYIVLATTMNNEVEVDINQVAESLNGKLDKTGGLVTGNVEITGNLQVANGVTMEGNLGITKSTPVTILKNTDLDKTAATTPDSGINSQFQVIDRNNNPVGIFYSAHDINNNFTTGIYTSRTVGGTDKNASFAVAIDSSGNDFAAATAGVKEMITRWGMPSGTSASPTLPASGGTYTAPRNGYLVFSKSNASSETNKYIQLTCNTVNSKTLQPWSGSSGYVFIPMKKGASATIYYSCTGSTNAFKFVYAEGEK